MVARLRAAISTALIGSTTEPNARNNRIRVDPTMMRIITGSQCRTALLPSSTMA